MSELTYFTKASVKAMTNTLRMIAMIPVIRLEFSDCVSVIALPLLGLD